LESVDGLRVVAAETSLVDTLDAVRQMKPSILMLDKGFGIHAVLDLLKAVRGVQNPTAVTIWSGSFTESEALRFLQAGASGVIRKTAPLEVLVRCIRAVAAGGTWMEEGMLTENEHPIRTARSPLTARELQVMELVERGLKNKDIAIQLGICTGTVKIHLKHIFEKTGIRGRYGLALSGLKEKGLLAIPA
jgi:DNA-binding NarL/FixJ family response regulator